MNNNSTITNSEINDKLLYSFMGIRLLTYSLFFLINGFQTFLEVKSLLNKQKRTTTRFFVFLSISLFCLFRSIQTGLFYYTPELGMPTLNFFFFSMGSAFLFVQWTFIIQFWLLIMYSLFVSDDIKTYRTAPIKLMTYVFSLVVIVYQIIISSLSLKRNIEVAESVGFLILLVIFVFIILFNGFYLIKHLKLHRKVAPMEHFDLMIVKTKILIASIIFVFVTIVAQELVFNMYYTDTYETPRQYLKLFIIGCIEFIQMVIVMLVLSNGHWTNYILFRKVKVTSESSTNSSSTNKKLKRPNEHELSGNTLSMGESDYV